MGGGGLQYGWEWGYCTRGLGTLQAIKTGSGSRNEAARVGMLALFQYANCQIETSIVSCQTLSHVNQTRLEDCLRREHYSITLESVITKHSTGVKAKHMTHKVSPITIGK